MPYQKPVFYAQTAPEGSYAAGCPQKDRAPYTNVSGPCPGGEKKCLNCERTKQ